MSSGAEHPHPIDRFERRLPAVPRSVPQLRGELAAWAAELGVAEDGLAAVKLAVSEAVTNAVMHAFIDRDVGTVAVSAEPGPDVLEVRVVDDGRGMGPRPDSPGLGMGVSMIGNLCATVDLGQGPGGTGTEVRMVFRAPGLAPSAGPADAAEHLHEILGALNRMGAADGFGGADIAALVELVVPRLADLCSVTLLEADGTARRLAARVARPDGSIDAVATDWVMAFPVDAQSSPSRQAAVTGQTQVTPIDRDWAYAVAPDAADAETLLDLGLTWWAAVPLRSGGRAVGSVAVAGRAGDPGPVVATLERIAEQAGGLVATARLVEDLRRTQARLERILGALSEAVTVTDALGRIVYANDAAARVLGAASAAELTATEPGTVAQRHFRTDAEGRPLDFDQLPHRQALRGRPVEPLLTRSFNRETGHTQWLRTTATLLEDGPLVVSVIQDLTAITEAELRQRLLAQAGDLLAAALGRPDAGEEVVRLAVPAIADGCGLDLVGPDGQLVIGAVHHVDATRAAALDRSRRRHPPGADAADAALTGGPSDVLVSGEIGLLNDITDELLQLGAHGDEHLEELRALGLRSVLTVPLTLHGQTLGLMTLANDVSGRGFSESDVALAVDLAHRAAIAVDNAKLQAAGARTQAKLQDSLRRLEALADAGFGGLIRGTGDRIIEANQTFLGMVGYASVAALPPWPRMTPPEWAGADARAVAQLEAVGTAEIFEKEYLRQDGGRVRVLLGATLVDPATFEWMAVVVDVTDRLGRDALEETGLDRVAVQAGAAGSGAPPDGAADIVGGLAAAVLIQRPGQGIVYANQAAAETMGMRSPQAVIVATPEQIAEGWDTFDEHGVRLTAERYPSRRILQGERSVPPLTVRTVNRRTGREYWRVIRARAVHAPDGTLAMAVSMTEDITETRRAVLTQRLLAEAGAVLSSSLDLASTLPRLVALAVPELADWCSVVMPDEHGVIRQVAVAHADPGKLRFAEEYDRRWAERVGDAGGAAAILRGGPATLLAELPDSFIDERIDDPEQRAVLRGLGMRSVIQVPLAPAGGKALGVLSLVNAESDRVFTDAELILAEELGRRAGLAVQNARLHAERSHIAATLQASLLPDALPEIDGFALASAYVPAGKENWVGGDFYDVFPVDGGFIAIVGDVAGHGAEAAALTAQARHTLRAIAESTGDPVRAVAHLNGLLVPRAEPALCTVCVVLFRVADDGAATASITCAGHPLPFLLSGGAARTVGEFGPLLGAWKDSAFTSATVDLAPDDVLVIYTDGVLELSAGRERFGEERLRATLAGAGGATAAVDAVQAALDAFGVGEPSDDTAVLAVQRRRVP